jgi:ribonucleoside-triphosphate reductase
LSEFYKILDGENIFSEDEIFDTQTIEQKIKEILAKNKLTKTLEEFIKIAIEKKQERDTKVSSKVSIQEYIDKEDWRINANANTGYSNAGMINNTAGKLIANYWLDNIYS